MVYDVSIFGAKFHLIQKYGLIILFTGYLIKFVYMVNELRNENPDKLSNDS